MDSFIEGLRKEVEFIITQIQSHITNNNNSSNNRKTKHQNGKTQTKDKGSGENAFMGQLLQSQQRVDMLYHDLLCNFSYSCNNT